MKRATVIEAVADRTCVRARRRTWATAGSGSNAPTRRTDDTGVSPSIGKVGRMHSKAGKAKSDRRVGLRRDYTES